MRARICALVFADILGFKKGIAACWLAEFLSAHESRR